MGDEQNKQQLKEMMLKVEKKRKEQIKKKEEEFEYEEAEKLDKLNEAKKDYQNIHMNLAKETLKEYASNHKVSSTDAVEPSKEQKKYQAMNTALKNMENAKDLEKFNDAKKLFETAIATQTNPFKQFFKKIFKKATTRTKYEESRNRAYEQMELKKKFIDKQMESKKNNIDKQMELNEIVEKPHIIEVYLKKIHKDLLTELSKPTATPGYNYQNGYDYNNEVVFLNNLKKALTEKQTKSKATNLKKYIKAIEIGVLECQRIKKNFSIQCGADILDSYKHYNSINSLDDTYKIIKNLSSQDLDKLFETESNLSKINKKEKIYLCMKHSLNKMIVSATTEEFNTAESRFIESTAKITVSENLKAISEDYQEFLNEQNSKIRNNLENYKKSPKEQNPNLVVAKFPNSKYPDKEFIIKDSKIVNPKSFRSKTTGIIQ